MTEFDQTIALARRYYLHIQAYEYSREEYPLTSRDVGLLVETMEAMQAEILRLRQELGEESKP